MAILAFESDSAQAAALRHVVCDLVGAKLTVVKSIRELLGAVRARTPELILLPALLPPNEESELLAFLRTLPERDRVETLITPALKNPHEDPTGSGWLRWGRRRPAAGPTAPAEPHVFAERLAWTLQRVREARPSVAAVEDETPASLLELIEASALAPPVGAEAATLPDVTTRLLRKINDERRVHHRFRASELQRLRGARIKFGPEVALVDVSAGGALVETAARLRPDAEAILELVGDARSLLVPFRVLRWQIAALDSSPRYRGACEFRTPLDLADLLVPDSLAAFAGAVMAPARAVVRNAW